MSHRSSRPASTSAAGSSHDDDDDDDTIRPTKGTDAVLHGGRVKEAQTSEEERREAIIVFCISANASSTVTPNTTLSGTLLKGQ